MHHATITLACLALALVACKNDKSDESADDSGSDVVDCSSLTMCSSCEAGPASSTCGSPTLEEGSSQTAPSIHVATARPSSGTLASLTCRPNISVMP